MEYEKVIWILDQRFDFLLDSFSSEYGIDQKDIDVYRSYSDGKRHKYRVHLAEQAPGGMIRFSEPEDINRQVSLDLARYKEKEDKRLLLVPFSGVGLPSWTNVDSVISTGHLAVRLNSKWNQYLLFNACGIKTPETWRVLNTDDLRILSKMRLTDYKKLVIKRDHLAGGYMMAGVSSIEQVDKYCSRPENQPSQDPDDKMKNGFDGEVKDSVFLISQYIEHEQSFAGMAVVGRDGIVRMCGITEQVLYEDFAYEGLIWPPYASDEDVRKITDATLSVGKELLREGYFGFYNVDFIKGFDDLYAVEINARFGFGTILYGLFRGNSFWKDVAGRSGQDWDSVSLPDQRKDGKRIILGKIKGQTNRHYSNLKPCSRNWNRSITDWFLGDAEGFEALFAGTQKEEEIFQYGSFIGMFGARLDGDPGREEVLRHFWDRCLSRYGGSKALLSMYVHDFCGIKNTTFNFDSNRFSYNRDKRVADNRRYRFICKEADTKKDGRENGEMDDSVQCEVMTADSDKAGIPLDFWGDKVTSVTLMIGENGSGKTTLMRLMIQWLCQLSAGSVPMERGGFIMRDGGTDYLIFFDRGRLCTDIVLPSPDTEAQISDRDGDATGEEGKLQILSDLRQIGEMLSDVELVYYTDTMTDLELEDKLDDVELSFLSDESLVKRLTRSTVGSFAVSPKDDLKQREFVRHIRMYLENMKDITWEQKFPLRYIRLSLPKSETPRDSDLLEKYNLLAMNIPKSAGDLASLLVPGAGLKNLLLRTAITDMVMGMAFLAESYDQKRDWKERERPPVSQIIAATFRREVIESERRFHLLKNRRAVSNVDGGEMAETVVGRGGNDNSPLSKMTGDLVKALEIEVFHYFDDLSLRNKTEIKKISQSFSNLFDTLLKSTLENGFSREDRESVGREAVFMLNLDQLEEAADKSSLNEWTAIWQAYLPISSYLPDWSFKWHYGSSGENNRGAFYKLLSIGDRLMNQKKNVWFVLDEIDNAYHPEWKRTAVDELLKACNSSRNNPLSFQLWLSTHSPIMLSDAPGESGIYFKKDGLEKKQEIVEKSTFGLQIYELFNEAFFMDKGVIGAFANRKISDYYQKLGKIEAVLKKPLQKKGKSTSRVGDYAEKKNSTKAILRKYERILDSHDFMLRLIDEPLLKGHLAMAEKLCRKLLEIRKRDPEEDD